MRSRVALFKQEQQRQRQQAASVAATSDDDDYFPEGPPPPPPHTPTHTHTHLAGWQLSRNFAVHTRNHMRNEPPMHTQGHHTRTAACTYTKAAPCGSVEVM